MTNIEVFLFSLWSQLWSYQIYVFIGTNVSDKKDGDGSSNGGGGDPDDVVDPDNEVCFYTKPEDHPFWSVDLKADENVVSVEVTQCLDEVGKGILEDSFN